MIRICEMGPRDGLQNVPAEVPTDAKVAFVDALSQARLPEIEAGAFVSPKWIPQLADSDDVFRRIVRAPGVTYSALVPNERGFDRALAARADKVAVFTAASETFSQRNVNATIGASLERFVPVLRRAKASRLPVRGYVSTAFFCPYEGRMAPEAVVDVIRRLVELGVDEVSIGDTIGKAQPDDVRALLDSVLPVCRAGRLAMHFHDTYGHAVSNALASLPFGIRTFDSSAGGIGGCPYAPGAKGNVATETLVQALRAAGEPVDVDLEALATARTAIAPYLLPAA